jgi:hypothetical protein
MPIVASLQMLPILSHAGSESGAVTGATNSLDKAGMCLDDRLD